MASDKLSNVIGAPFAEYVLTQLNLRAAHNSTGEGVVPTRSDEEILFLANKMSWVKLTSSVRVQPESNNGAPTPISEFYKKLGLDYANPEDLAKNWTLEAGTSKANGANIDLRYGIGPEGAYGLGGTEELGYRPMPGLTSVTIDTKGTLGSLREATISFKVLNMNQLNVIEALYFRLGYSMLLEWGHNQFYINANQQGGGGTFTSNTYGINPFQANLRKEILQQQIAKRSYDLSGNYDGMLGIVTNFHWAFNQAGGYDCTVRLVGLGSIITSLKVNLSYKMPSALFEAYKTQNETLQAAQDRLNQIATDNEEAKKRTSAGLDRLPAVAANPNQIYTNIYTADLGTATVPLTTGSFLQNIALPTAYNVDIDNKATNIVLDYYYKAEHGGSTSNPKFTEELNQKRAGLFLSPLQNVRPNWMLVPADNYPAVTLSTGLLNLTAFRASQLNNGLGYVDLQNTNLLGADNFIKAFDYNLYYYPKTSLVTAINSLGSGNGLSLGPDEYIYSQAGAFKDVPLTVTLLSPAYIKDPKTGNAILRPYALTIIYTPLPDPEKGKEAEDLLIRPTRRELIAAVEKWFTSSRQIQITSIENTTNTSNNVTVKGTINLPIANKQATILTIEFTNTALIQTVLASPVAEYTPQNITQDANAGNTGGVDNSTVDTQTDPGSRFASALHAMLAAAKSQIQYEMNKTTEGVTTFSLLESTKAFYKDSILDGLFTLQENKALTSFDLKQYALKGFNSNLMVNPDLFTKIKPIDFSSLTTAYGIRWTVENDTNQISHPTYIKLGYLLSFINTMCLIYDSTQNTDKHPYVYLDFNPDTNFCLTTPQHMSIDPFTCMIPFEGDQKDYLSLFPKDVAPNPDPTSTVIFNENLNAVSGYLPKFKANGNPYQGSTMEILLNIDFLVQTLNSRTTNNEGRVVDLKGFLDDIMTGINTSTGNLNTFRVSYRDDSNTVIIKDDQFVPPIPGESWEMNTNSSPTNYGVPNGVNVPKYGQLPVFGKYSLVRDMRLETDMSTNLSNIIAISGQSNTTAVNSTDHSSFSWLNTNFKDVYKPLITDSSDITSKTNKNQLTKEEQKAVEEKDEELATQFNQHVVSIYYGKYPLAKSMVASAMNYYVAGMAKVKSTNGITLAAPFIPANLNLTVDGIAGIVMGNAFTIPEDRLPLSLRGDNGTIRNTKVGFVVVGFTHTLDNNQWLTKIRGQMIKLRDSSDYGIAAQLKKLQTSFPQAINANNSTTVDLTSLNLNQDWVGIAFQFISAKEGFLSNAKFDITRFRGGYGSDNIVTIDASGKATVSTVTSSTTFTRVDAERTLKYNIAGLYRDGVVGQIGKDKWDSLNDKQKAALISYAYNAGPGALKTWGIQRALQINAPKEQVAQFITAGPITAGGAVLSGLVTRRKEEAKLYLS